MVTLALALVAPPLLAAPAAAHEPDDCDGHVVAEWSVQEAWTWQRLCSRQRAELLTAEDRPRDNVLTPGFLTRVLGEEDYSEHLGDSVQLEGARFMELVALDDLRVEQSLYITESVFEAGASLMNARVDGNLSLRGSEFRADLDLSDVRVEDNLFLSGGAEFTKPVDLTDADIGEDLSLRESVFRDDVNGTGLQAAGDITAIGAQLKDVSFLGGSAGGHVILAGAEVDGYIDLSGLDSEGTLRLAYPENEDAKTPAWTTSSTLDLRGTVVSGIDDSTDSWPPALHLTGFSYEAPSGEYSGSASAFGRREETWYRGWLQRDTAGATEAYQTLETMLRNQGQTRLADRVAIARLDVHYSRAPLPRQTLGLLHKVTVGYGYRPEWIIGPVVVLLALGAVVARGLPPSPLAPSRLVFSAQRLIPFVNFGKDYVEYDVTSTSVPARIRRYFYVHSLLGYVMAALLLAAIARLTATQS